MIGTSQHGGCPRVLNVPFAGVLSKVVLLSATALLLTGCSGDTGVQAETPKPSATTSPAGASPVPTSTSTASPVDTLAAVKAVVQKRYEEYYVVVAEAGATSNPDDPRLAQYSTDGVLANLRGKFAVRRTEGRHVYGRSVPHVSAITLTGATAKVQDCLDNSATGLMDKSGRKLNVGRAQQQTIATLVVENGIWKVAELATVAGGGSC